jgi:hypothetical protein
MYVLQVTNAVNDCRDFLRFSTKGFIVLAAFEVVSVNSNENFKNKTQNLDNKEEKHLAHTRQIIIADWLSLSESREQLTRFYHKGSSSPRVAIADRGR